MAVHDEKKNPAANGSDGLENSVDYRATLNLPQTPFEMKANLTQREPGILARWKQTGLYQRIRARRHPRGKWVLHDGPPYANGDIHMGHLVNKVLKDIVVKFRTMQGYDAPFVPGWDCHGLPIESAVQKQLGPKMRQMPPDEIRRLCRDYALRHVAIQTKSFERLGVFGDYQRPYLTLDPAYEAGVLDVLADLLKRRLVYRQRKPVHWCVFDQTALAEAELEYKPKQDPSIFVQFQLELAGANWPPIWGPRPAEAFLLIWTTTPWTLPANRAVAIGPDHDYVCVRRHDESRRTERKTLIVAARLVPSIREHDPGISYDISKPIKGSELASLAIPYRHPLEPSRLCPVVLADYVTLEDGAGLVHTAPGHGIEDYRTGRRYDLETYCPVLPDGRYDETVPEFLRGRSIWRADEPLLAHLREKDLLLTARNITHSYPHCWRCGKPTILRATEQWFIRASRTATETPGDSGAPDLLPSAQAFVEQVRWIPGWGKNRIAGMLETRPDWCISRQRCWGVPIPAFFAADGTILLSEKSVRQAARHVRQHGADSWFTDSPAKILASDQWLDDGIGPDGRIISNTCFHTSQLRQGSDILDVWFESGASHRAVLEGTHPELGYPAKMYLEGSDQHRGWFQSSLLEAAGYRDHPPFEQVLTHGFIVDAHGRKMSKSQGNDIKVSAALQQNGADILRLWVASVDYQNDMPCSQELFTRTGEAYRKIRNTLRYLLGNLFDFDAGKDETPPPPHSIDTWMWHRLSTVRRTAHAAYENYEFHRVFRTVYEFCNVDISAVYAKAIKDRLYCELPESPRRRASQTMCRRLLIHLLDLIAPILVFTAEEAWQAMRELPLMKEHGAASIHEEIFQALPDEPAADLVRPWELLMPLVEDGFKQLDDMKRTIGLGNPLDSEALIVVPRNSQTPESRRTSELMAAYGPELEDVLGVGYHRIVPGDTWGIKILDVRERYSSCARSWKRRPDVGSDPEYPALSARDAMVVRELKKRGS